MEVRREVELIERELNDFHKPLSFEQLKAICQGTFGNNSVIEQLKELGAGTFNNTYQIKLQGHPEMILRVAPDPRSILSSEEHRLMRREVSIYPYFAAITDLIPTIIATDFTRQLLDRDYMFLSFLEGELWSDQEANLTPQEQAALWKDFAGLVKRINSVVGHKFGFPYPEAQYDTWSRFIIERLQRAREDLAGLQMEQDITRLDYLVSLIQVKAGWLDEITQPRLLHGDLWTFNLLIAKNPESDGPKARIVGLLDLDHALWGDPLADWTFFVFNKTTFSKEYPYSEIFWQEYGRPELSYSADFRQLVYEAMHACLMLGWAGYRRDTALLERARDHLKAKITQLKKKVS